MKYSAFLMTFLIATAASAADTDISGASNVATGMAANGDYIIPKIMAESCKIKMQDTDEAAKATKECLSKLLKDRNDTVESSRSVGETFTEMAAQSKLETLKTMVAEGIYASNFEDTVVKEFEEKGNGDSDSALGALGDIGSGSMLGINLSDNKSGEEGNENGAANIREDIAVLAEADYDFAIVLNSHLNKVLSTEIMNKALKYLSAYDASYIKELAEEGGSNNE